MQGLQGLQAAAQEAPAPAGAGLLLARIPEKVSGGRAANSPSLQGTRH